MGSPELDDLLQKLAATRNELIAHVSAMSEEAAATPPAPGEWSAKQQLGHLAYFEPLFTRAARRVLAEEAPDVSAEFAHPQGQYEEANDKLIAALLNNLAASRGALVALVERTDVSQLERLGRKTPFGDLTLQQLYRALYRHDRMHIDQIAGRQSSFQPKRQDH